MLQTPTKMQFAPVLDDGDEILKAIQSDSLVQEDNWDLHENVNPEQIDAFLDDALREFGADPVEQEN